MKKIINGLILLSVFTASASPTEFKIDEKDKIEGVSLRTGKKKKVRMYEGRNTKVFEAPIAQVVDGLMDFESRCNNEYANKRVNVSKDFKCKDFNKNIVETVRITKLKPFKLEKNETDRFLLQRLIYNRDKFRHYDLVRVFKYKNEKKQTTYKIIQRMLSNKEAKSYLNEPFNKESAFIETRGTYLVTSLGPNKTEFDYTYTSKTDHWLLNKSFVVGRFFDGMSKGINGLFKAIKRSTTETASK